MVKLLLASFFEEDLKNEEYLGQRSFMLVLLAAFTLHLAAIMVWHLMPKVKVVEIPVRALNIKLGGGDGLPVESQPAAGPPDASTMPAGDMVSRTVRDDTADTKARAKALEGAMAKMLEAEKKSAPNTEAASNALDKLMGVEKPVKPKARELPKKAGKPQDKGPISVRDEGKNVPAPAMPVTAADLAAPHQFTRETPGDAQKMTYSQSISEWLDQFKIDSKLPADAPAVVNPIVHIHIDRQGNILSRDLAKSSGYDKVDREAMDIVSRAGHVPPAPADYQPAENTLDFDIPVLFK